MYFLNTHASRIFPNDHSYGVELLSDDVAALPKQTAIPTGPRLVTASIPPFSPGEPYSTTVKATSDQPGGVTFSSSVPLPPDGITLNPDGTMTGTPDPNLAYGSYPMGIVMDDMNSPAYNVLPPVPTDNTKCVIWGYIRARNCPDTVYNNLNKGAIPAATVRVGLSTLAEPIEVVTDSTGRYGVEVDRSALPPGTAITVYFPGMEDFEETVAYRYA